MTGNLLLNELKYVLNIIRLISNEKNTYLLSSAQKVETEDNYVNYNLMVNKNKVKTEINIFIKENEINILEKSNDKEIYTIIKQNKDEVEIYTSEDKKTKTYKYILENITKTIPSELLIEKEIETTLSIEESNFKLRDERRLEDLREIISDSIQIKGLLKSVDDAYLKQYDGFLSYKKTNDDFDQLFGIIYDKQRKFLSELSREKLYNPLFRLYAISSKLINKEEFDKYFSFEFMDNTNSIYYKLKDNEELEKDINNKLINNDIIFRDITRAYQTNEDKKILEIRGK